MPRAASLVFVLGALAGCATIPDAPERQRFPPVTPRADAEGDGPARAEDDAQAAGESDLPDTAADAPAKPRSDGALEEAGRRDEAPADFGLGPRLAARALTFLGRRGPFRATGASFKGDCSGLAQAVYAAEGVDLQGMMQEAAPHERVAVKAAWLAAGAHGRTFGAESWPRPGDLAFWRDTYDRNRNRKTDDGLTHVGIVERVEDGTVYFVHRGARGVARGVMTPGSRSEASAPDGRRLNSTLRARSHPVKKGGLAGELFAGYARFDGAGAAAQGDETTPGATPPPASPGTSASEGPPVATTKATRARPTSAAVAKSRASRAKAGPKAAAGAKKKKRPHAVKPPRRSSGSP